MTDAARTCMDADGPAGLRTCDHESRSRKIKYKRIGILDFFFLIMVCVFPKMGKGLYSEVVQYRDNLWPGRSELPNPMAEFQKSV